MKIDSETSVPIGWVISGMGAILIATITGAFWVASVNDRLSRIEDKLGIPPLRHSVSAEAFARETKK